MTSKLDLAALLRESEAVLWQAPARGDARRAHAVARATNDQHIYELWRLRHERLMRPVARAEGRFGQPAALRKIGVRLIQRAALVDYLRDRHVVGRDRDRLLARLRGARAAGRALLDEHRDYVIAVTSAACVDHLLRCVADHFGPRLLREYQTLYGKCFAAFCERLAAEGGAAAVLDDVVPLNWEALRLRDLLTNLPRT